MLNYYSEHGIRKYQHVCPKHSYAEAHKYGCRLLLLFTNSVAKTILKHKNTHTQ